MDNEYILSFSSFYKAAYARDVLEQQGISSTLRKLPPNLARSCSTGVYLRIDSIQRVRQVLDEREIVAKGVYQITRNENGVKTYSKL